MQLTDLIRVYENVLTAEQCESIIAGVDARDHMMKLHDTPLYTFYQMEVVQTDMAPVAHQFASIVSTYASHYFQSLGFSDFVGVQGFEGVKIKKYLKNSEFEFRPHLDVIDKASCVRYLQCLLYLNDNDGNTMFDMLGVSVKPKQGSMLVFPPMWMFPHSAKAPTTDDKYLMMTTLHYT